MRRLIILPLAVAALTAGCGSDQGSKAEMACIDANQRLQELVPRINRSEKQAAGQAGNLKAMSRIVSEAARRIQAAPGGPPTRELAERLERLASLYLKAAGEGRRATDTLEEAQAVQRQAAALGIRAGLRGCGGSGASHAGSHS